jgi:hypothetical protein
MAHFAKLDENNMVQEVIVVHNDCAPNEQTGQEFLASIGYEGIWKQTSYNTKSGIHELGGTPFRKNYAGEGFTYDERLDAFIPPKPTQTETRLGKPIVYELDENTCQWIRIVIEL